MLQFQKNEVGCFCNNIVVLDRIICFRDNNANRHVGLEIYDIANYFVELYAKNRVFKVVTKIKQSCYTGSQVVF
jgi:hypothetical protein